MVLFDMNDDTTKKNIEPLPKEETKLLCISALVQGALFIALGAVLYLVGSSISDVLYEVGLVGRSILSMRNILVALVSILLMIVIAKTSESALRALKKTHDAEDHQGILGEVIQLPTWIQLLWFSLTGISEEMLFRFGMIGIIAPLFSLSIPNEWTCIVLAIVLSSLVFTLMHLPNSKTKQNIIVIFFLGIILSCVWIATSSIVYAMFVHATYDMIVILMEKRKMRKDPQKFFGGKRPYDLLLSAGSKK